MTNLASRLRNLERTLGAAQAPMICGTMDYDERGNPATFEVGGQAFHALPGETEDELVQRGRRTIGDETSDLVLTQFVRAEDGKPAPGFERFAHA